MSSLCVHCEKQRDNWSLYDFQQCKNYQEIPVLANHTESTYGKRHMYEPIMQSEPKTELEMTYVTSKPPLQDHVLILNWRPSVGERRIFPGPPLLAEVLRKLTLKF